jgi:hypothetical protein
MAPKKKHIRLKPVILRPLREPPRHVMALDLMHEMLKSRAQFEQAMWQMFALLFVEQRPLGPAVRPRATVGVACHICSAKRGDVCEHLVDDAVDAT